MSSQAFVNKHVGSLQNDIDTLLESVSCKSIDELLSQVIPSAIINKSEMGVGNAISEFDYLQTIKAIAAKNKLYKNFIGQGYYGTIMPSVIKRNMLENAGWYTSYTPYQAEISQGRLEALLNYQTVITDLTGMAISNASLLDEGTSAAEAMLMFHNNLSKQKTTAGANQFFIDAQVFTQTINVVKIRAKALGIEIVTGDWKTLLPSEKIFGALIQYPDAKGEINDFKTFTEQLHSCGAKVCVAADLLSLTLLTPPGEWGADVVVGSTQRLGLPMAYGGPHAGFFATTNEFTRKMPGRIIGMSIDAAGNPALRMALQTREQHIKREKATSNICTSQALLANMSGMFAVYHGKEGLVNIATTIANLSVTLAEGLKNLGYSIENKNYFDTISMATDSITKIKEIALAKCVNLNYKKATISISLDETTSFADVELLLSLFAEAKGSKVTNTSASSKVGFADSFIRKSDFLTAEVFNAYRCETDIMRYIKSLENKDFSLVHGMIPLGSCTMKLNAATEMLPLSWDEFGGIHPFVPNDQAEGYLQIINELSELLLKITGFGGISFQPNSGASGEYAGLLAIKAYHEANGNGHKNIILIPSSAHGTNPASAIMAGFETVTIPCDENGNISVDTMIQKAQEHKEKLAGVMITYPSTHGVFEEEILQMTNVIHQNGGLVYMDGANMNAQVGYTSPASIGADVCHLNLHKTFAIPHGGGGPGVGPVLVRKGLEQFLPSPKVWEENNISLSSAPYGSALVLIISYSYIKMLGDQGLKHSTAMAILNANYIAENLKAYYPILYTNKNGRCAHEMILDCHEFKKTAGIEVTDIAKRLMDYGFHAPTVSFPVHDTLMVEPTESESLKEMNRFIDSMISIREEIAEIEAGKADQTNNVLKNAPHTSLVVTAENWDRPYTRQKAVFPFVDSSANKYWPTVSRINDAHGDRNLVCSCSE
jgi:glycine dehydrogenase